MKKNMTQLVFGLFLTIGILALPAYADLGLAQALSDQGAQAVGSAVKEAAEAIYAGTDDLEQIKSQLIAILNEAAATGDEGAMRYAIAAIMMVGGVENLDFSKAVINESDLMANYPDLIAATIVAAERLIVSGGDIGTSGGETQGKGVGGNGEGDTFDFDADSGDIDDDDVQSTPV